MSKKRSKKKAMPAASPRVTPEENPLPDEGRGSAAPDTSGQQTAKPNISAVEEPRKATDNIWENDLDQAAILQTLCQIATNAWRAKTKMVNPETGEAREEMKRVFRHIEAIYESLTQIGIEIKDLTGRTYDSGMALKVIVFEPTPGLTKEEIKATVKPTIVFQGRLLQVGEVIVGTPQATELQKG